MHLIVSFSISFSKRTYWCVKNYQNINLKHIAKFDNLLYDIIQQCYCFVEWLSEKFLSFFKGNFNFFPRVICVIFCTPTLLCMRAVNVKPVSRIALIFRFAFSAENLVVAIEVVISWNEGTWQQSTSMGIILLEMSLLKILFIISKDDNDMIQQSFLLYFELFTKW